MWGLLFLVFRLFFRRGSTLLLFRLSLSLSRALLCRPLLLARRLAWRRLTAGGAAGRQSRLLLSDLSWPVLFGLSGLACSVWPLLLACVVACPRLPRVSRLDQLPLLASANTKGIFLGGGRPRGWAVVARRGAGASSRLMSRRVYRHGMNILLLLGAHKFRV